MDSIRSLASAAAINNNNPQEGINTMKKIIIVLLALVLCVLPVLTACNDDPNPNPPSTTGTEAPGTTAPVTEPKPDPVTTTEPAAFGDFDYILTLGYATIVGYHGNGGDVVIPEKIDGKYPVTEIAKMAFMYQEAITSLTIPGSVKATGELAFFHCVGLTKVTLGSGVEKISRGSFNACEALAEIVVPASVKTIEDIAFVGCTALTSFDFTNVTTLGYRAFAASGLTSVVLPAGLTNLGESVFGSCKSLVSADIQGVYETFPAGMFGYCYALKNVKFAEGTKRIGNTVFFRCTGLETVTLPASCFKIENQCFYGCTSLNTINFLCKEKMYINYYAFYFLPALTTCNYGGSEETFGTWEWDTYNDFLKEATFNFNYAG